jgi:hypothetical protein
MTDKEKAIVMAYTGICMLTGDKFQIFHKYVEDIMGRPVYTHEMATDAVDNEIKEKSKADFIALCKDDSGSENPNKWIPVSVRLPEDHKNVLIYLSSNQITIGLYNSHRLPFMDKPIGWGADAPHGWSSDEVVAWMPLPEPYKASPTRAESEDKE